MTARRRSLPWAATLVLGCVALGDIAHPATPAPAQANAAQTPAAGGDFIYHARPHDTLIGISRRLLIRPRQWPALQSLNRIADPRRIPEDTPLRIPYEWLRMTPETAAVTSLGGSVTQSGNPLSAGARLAQGSVVETGPDGSVTLDLADGSSITLQKSSALTLGQMQRVDGVESAHSIQLHLDSGRVEAHVKPHRDVGRFEISTPVAVSAVRGTRFRDGFDVDGAHAITETLDGSVDVGSTARAVPVPAGFGTRVDRDAAPLAPIALLPPPDLSQVPALTTESVTHIAWPAVAGADHYRVQASDDPDFHVLIADLVVGAAAVELPELAEGPHWLRVRAVDALGLEGRDSLVQLTRHRLPDTPSLQGPPDGARLSDAGTRFTWSVGAPPDHFRLQVAQDPAFANVAITRDDPASGGSGCCDLPPGRYYWRVAGIDAHGDSGPWSAARSYVRLVDAPRPDAPRLDGKILRLGWPVVAAPRYRVEVARDAAFTQVLVAQVTDVASLVVPRPFPGVYYERIQVLDAEGAAGPYGPARRFEVPVPLWVEILAPVAMLLPLVL